MWNGVTVIQSGAAQAVDGSGTASYVARFTDVNTLGTGVIYDNGTNVGIGTTSPQVLLHVNGQAYLQALNLTGGIADRILATDTNKNITYLNTSTYPSLTELSYVKGVTSSVQTQLNSKAAGTGTTGKIPKWSSTTALTDSIMSESSTVVNIAGSLNGQSDDSYLSFDANSNRVGITKKGGFFSKFTYGSAAEFAIAQSNATNILPTGTFTDRFIITSNGTIRFPGLTSNGFLKTGSSNGTLSVDTTSYQTLLTNPVTGTGTTNYISKWTSASAQGNSLIFDNGTNVGIGTASPSQKVDIRYPAGGGMALLKATDTTDGLLFGDMAYSTSNIHQGIKHAAMTGGNDYMIISEGTNTYISAKSGGMTIIGAGGDDASSQIRLTSTEVVVNENSSSRDFRVESNNNANMLFVDGVTDNVGIGKSPGNATLDVAGTFKYANSHFSNTIYSYNNGILITTNLPANSSNMFELTIEGNSYSGSTGPIFGRIQGYNYSVGPTILESSYISTHTSTVNLMHHNGYLCIWLTQPSLFTSFTFKFIATFAPSYYITSITNVAKPTTNVTFDISVGANRIWTSLNDGADSGLDADTLDGQQGSYYQPLLTNPVTGTGTTNYIPKWTGTTTQSNSLIYDNGTNVGIGTTTPQRRLDLGATGQMTFGNAVTANTNQGIYWHIDSDYGIYRTAGTWTASNYQQLMIKFATGIVLHPGGGVHNKSHVGVVGGVSIGASYYTTKYNDGLIVQGNVGIGTTSPSSKLDVNGEIRSDALALDSNTPGTTTNKLYNNSGFLKFNGDNVPLSTDTTVKDIRVMTVAAYGSLSPKDSNTLYFLY
jgi:hypothetical protein